MNFQKLDINLQRCEKKNILCQKTLQKCKIYMIQILSNRNLQSYQELQHFAEITEGIRSSVVLMIGCTNVLACEYFNRSIVYLKSIFCEYLRFLNFCIFECFELVLVHIFKDIELSQFFLILRIRKRPLLNFYTCNLIFCDYPKLYIFPNVFRFVLIRKDLMNLIL